MKRFVLSLCALALIVTSVGCVTCSCDNCRQRRFQNQCREFGGGRCGHQGCGPQCRLGQGGHGGGLCGSHQAAPIGAASVGYPYYTLRGPRDFLDANPRSIGP